VRQRLIHSIRDHSRRARNKWDPRLSLEERYGDHRGYVEAVRTATRELIRAGLMIEDDEERYVADAESSTVLQ